MRVLSTTAIIASVALLGTLVPAASPADAHTLKHRLGGYRDSTGTTRQRVGFDATVEGKSGGANLSASSVNVVVARDLYEDSSMTDEDDEYTREIYGEGQRISDSATISASQTWERLTDTRVMAAYATDKKVTTRTWGVGASQWYRHETVRVGWDLTRTIVEQPSYRVLDYDSEQIGNPTVASSVGVGLSVRHLATPTTLVDYGVNRLENENRPATNSGSVAVRQFLPPLDGAVHAGVTRAVNRGYVSTDSNYGQVDAWICDASYLQNLWLGARARVGYRYYEEDETTRAYESERQLGSDTATVALSQDLDKRQVDSLSVPLTVEAAASRYANNDGVSARTYEVGISARF